MAESSSSPFSGAATAPPKTAPNRRQKQRKTPKGRKHDWNTWTNSGQPAFPPHFAGSFHFPASPNTSCFPWPGSRGGVCGRAAAMLRGDGHHRTCRARFCRCWQYLEPKWLFGQRHHWFSSAPILLSVARLEQQPQQPAMSRDAGGCLLSCCTSFCHHSRRHRRQPSRRPTSKFPPPSTIRVCSLPFSL